MLLRLWQLGSRARGLVVGQMQHQAHVRIRDTGLVYAALQYEQCFNVVLGSRVDVPA